MKMKHKKLFREAEEFKKIDDIVAYLDSKKGLKWTKVVKFQRLNAHQSEGNEDVETVGSDGNKETKRTTKKGDWIVNNVTNKDNKWIIDDKTFQKKYEKEKGDVYKPKGGPMLAAKVSDCEDTGVVFAPPNWGGDVIKIQNDGWFMKDPTNKKDIYAISKKDFDSTYRDANGKPLKESIGDSYYEDKWYAMATEIFDKMHFRDVALAVAKKYFPAKADVIASWAEENINLAYSPRGYGSSNDWKYFRDALAEFLKDMSK